MINTLFATSSPQHRNKMFMPDSDSAYSRKPAAVAKPSGAADCGKIIKFAAKHSLLISVRAGGHNVAGSALCDGGLVINMRGMNQTIVDPVAQTATTQGMLILSHVDFPRVFVLSHNLLFVIERRDHLGRIL